MIDSDDFSSEVFQQPQRSLLGEALRRPLGIAALLALLLAATAFSANYFMLDWEMLDDYALVAFFVACGLLLSILLRSGTTGPLRVRIRSKRDESEIPLPSSDLILEDEVSDDPSYATTSSQPSPGLAEPSPANTPAASPTSGSTVFTDDTEADEEVDGYQKALVHYVAKGDLHGQGEILRRLGHVAKTRGHLKESREFYFNARSCFKQIDDNYAEAAVLLDLGQVLESLGDHDAASAAYRDANRALLDVAMNSGDRERSYQASAAD
ncbi:MAG: tetratricopeptide repeat protein [Geminicoccaceae bacterium]